MLQGFQLVTSLVLLATACSRSEQAPQPAPSPPPVDRVPAAIPAPTPSVAMPAPTGVVADLMFAGDALETCDEMGVPPERLKILQSAKPEKGEIIRPGETCDQATSSKAWQATCKRPDGLATFYYRAAALEGSDKQMRACLSKGGSWMRNESNAARREAAEQSLARAQKLLHNAE
jgi:hypothetical protein